MLVLIGLKKVLNGEIKKKLVGDVEYSEAEKELQQLHQFQAV